MKHLKKATSQLAGASGNIHRGLLITDKAGKEVHVTRDQPIHCIALIPELSLVAECEGLVNELTYSLLQSARAIFNLLDINELHNLVYNAASLASRSMRVTRMMAFDGMLLERFKLANRERNPYVRFAMRVTETI